MVRAVRGNLDHLAAQPSHQRSVFAHRVNHDDPILRDGEKHIQELTLAAKLLPEPVEPKYIPFADFSFLRSAMMTL